MQIFLWIIGGIWIAFLAWLFIPAMKGSIPAERESPWYMQRSLLILLLVIIFAFVIGRFDPGALSVNIIPNTVASGIAGIILTMAGLGFSGWARFNLGRYWSSMVMIKTGHQLIRTGPYRFVRNPMYTGILVAFLGAVIAIGELPAFFALAIGIISIWVKIKAEEELLLEKFGEEYTRYKQEVKAIIPFVL